MVTTDSEVAPRKMLEIRAWVSEPQAKQCRVHTHTCTSLDVEGHLVPQLVDRRGTRELVFGIGLL
jgi:hypothetical protein